MKTITRLSLGLALLSQSFVSAQIPKQPALPPVMGATVYCPLAGKGAMGVGWTEAAADGKFYRCLPVFDESLKPIGAAWARVEENGTIGARLPQ